MGLTNISATITNLDDRRKQASGEFLVDTGAGYTVIPYSMVKKLNLKPTKKQIFSLADGTTVTRNMGYALIKVDFTNQKAGVQEAPSAVVLGQPNDSALLGVITLENMGLIVDPFKRELRPMKLMLA